MFLRSLSEGQERSQELALFIDALKPYGTLTLDELISILEDKKNKRKSHADIEKRELLRKATLSQLKDSEFRSLLSREELSELAQRELGISKWKIMKMSRNEMEKVIQNALENVETLDTIARRASSKE